jgi:uncharacterized damage-inducible protein DinB
MSKEPETGTLDFYRARHAAETPLTKRLLLSLGSADLAYRPHDRSPSAADLFSIIVRGLFIRNELAANLQADVRSGPPASYDVLIGRFEELSSALSEKLLQLDQDRWEKPATLHANEQVALARPLGEILWIFHFDLIHHRGQLSSYLRPMGLRVPSIYGKSGDDGVL